MRDRRGGRETLRGLPAEAPEKHLGCGLGTPTPGTIPFGDDEHTRAIAFIYDDGYIWMDIYC